MANLPIIKTIVGKIEFNSLIDTGSSICCISPELFEKIKAQQKIKYITRNCQIMTLTGESVEYRACIELTLKIGNQKVSHEFFVTRHSFGKDYHSILGYNLFKKFRTQLNLEGKYLRLNDAKIPILETKNQSVNNLLDVEFPVSLVKKVTLGPNQTAILELSLGKNTLNDDTKVIFEPKEQIDDLDLESSINLVNKNRIKIIVTNLKNEKRALNKNMRFGTIGVNFEIKGEISDENVNLIVASEEIIKQRKSEFNLNSFDLSHLKETEKSRIEDLLTKNYAVFSSSLKTLGHTDLVKPKIELVSELPIACKSYNIPYAIRDDAKKILEEMIEAGIISKSTSNYAAPILFVKKKTSITPNNNLNDKGQLRQKWRVATDLRMLNQWTISHPVRPPKISDIINKLSGHKYFSSLDLMQGFLQIDIDRETSEKFAFSSMFGNMEWRRLPFGYKNSPAYFLTLMNECLKDVGPGIFHYLDDVVIAANSAPEMLERLQRVFDVFKTNNLTLSPEKCKFLKTDIDFLGYNISENGVTPIAKNIKKIVGFQTPRTKRQLKCFLSCCSFYRNLIPNYSELAGELEELTSEKRTFKWTDTAEIKFRQLQSKFFQKPIVTQPDFSKKFILVTDASKMCIAGYLAQEVDGILKPISYFSKKLSKSQQKYSAIKLELFAIYQSVKYFREYLFGDFVILCDHKSLSHHKKLQNPPSVICNWLLYLQEFSFTIKYIEGKKNCLSDYLSRFETIKNEINLFSNTEIINAVTTRSRSKINNPPPINISNEAYTQRGQVAKSAIKKDEPLSVDVILKEQLQDEQVRILREHLSKGKMTNKYKKDDFFIDPDSQLIKKIVKVNNESGKSIYTETIVVPEVLKQKIIKTIHKTHLGVYKSYALLKERYFWTGMYADLKRYVLSCDGCLSVKPSKQRHIPHGKTFTAKGVLDIIYIDLVGPLKCGRYILTVLDGFSKFLEAYVINNITAETVAKKLIKYFATFGTCNRLIADNGSQFTSELVRLINNAFGTIMVHILEYSPWINNVERNHKQLKEAILAWDDCDTELETKIDLAKAFYNASIHSSTKFSPSYVFFMRETKKVFDIEENSNIERETYSLPVYFTKFKRVLSEVTKQVTTNQLAAKEKRNSRSKLKSSRRTFKTKDLVYVKDTRGFRKHFNGPWTVTRVLSPHVVLISDGIKVKKISVARLKKSA